MSGQWIPNRHVWFYDNVIYNPDGVRSQWSQFAVAGPISPPAGSGVPDPSLADDDLQIVDNVIWNGPADLDLGVPNPDAVRAANAVNTVRPELVDPAGGDYRLSPGAPVAAIPAVEVPGWYWDDASVPAGSTDGVAAWPTLGARR
jgi:hypothetical protein